MKRSKIDMHKKCRTVNKFRTMIVNIFTALFSAVFPTKINTVATIKAYGLRKYKFTINNSSQYNIKVFTRVTKGSGGEIISQNLNLYN